jgi:hypothetical protein
MAGAIKRRTSPGIPIIEMHARRKFLRLASGLIVGFPFIIRSQVPNVPGSGAIIGGAQSRRSAAAGGGGGGDTAAVTGQSLGSLRNNFDGDVGFRFFVNTPMTITQLGRWVVSGNSSTHIVHLKSDAGSDLTTASVNTSGATAGQFRYASCTPYVHGGGGYLRLESTEAVDDDQWYDFDTTITTTADISDDGRSSNGVGDSTGNDTYGPVSFKYHL